MLVNKPKVAAYRAPGAPQAMYAMESAVDDLARELGMDPIDLRLMNAADEGTQAPYGPTFPPIGIRDCLQAAKAHPNYTTPKGEGVGARHRRGFWFNIGMQSSAEVRLSEDGTVTVVEGNPDIGGTRASMCLMARRPSACLTRPCAPTWVTRSRPGSATSPAAAARRSPPAWRWSRPARTSSRSASSARPRPGDIDADQVDWTDGEAVPQPGVNVDVQPLSLADIAGNAGRTGGPILGRASLNAQGAGASFSVNMADVTVDRETGKVDVVNFTAIQDAGTAIHRAYVEGQMQGGAVQGLGLGPERGVRLRRQRRDGERGFPRLPGAGDVGHADDRHAHRRGCRTRRIRTACAAWARRPSWPRCRSPPTRCATPSGFRIPDLPLSPPNVLAAIDAPGGGLTNARGA